MTKRKSTEKTCKVCKNTLPVTDFRSKSGKSTYALCPECRRKTAKKKMRSRRMFDYSFLRKYLIGIMGGRCIRCGYDEFADALEFHHVDRALKENSISSYMTQFCYGATASQWKILEAEVLKCTVLCSNCHQTFHRGAWNNLEALQRKSKQPTSIPMPTPE